MNSFKPSRLHGVGVFERSNFWKEDYLLNGFLEPTNEAYAIAKIAGPNGIREANVEDICVGPRQTSIESNELLISINFPINPSGFGASYLRFIPRNEMDIAVAAAGVSVVIENGKFINARVSLASVAPKPLFVKEAGDVLVGKPVSPESIQEAISY